MRDSLQRMGELDRWRPSGHVDSLFIARAVFQGQPLPSSFKLERLAQFFGLPPFAAHDAAEDSLASWHVLRATLQRGQIMQEQGAWAPLPSLPPLLTPNVALSPEQMQFQALALQGRNMFITGGAGTGKSFLLNSIVAQMQLQRGPKSCVVLSPTGAAAVLVNGRTIHSFFSLGIPKTWGDFQSAFIFRAAQCCSRCSIRRRRGGKPRKRWQRLAMPRKSGESLLKSKFFCFVLFQAAADNPLELTSNGPRNEDDKLCSARGSKHWQLARTSAEKSKIKNKEGHEVHRAWGNSDLQRVFTFCHEFWSQHYQQPQSSAHVSLRRPLYRWLAGQQRERRQLRHSTTTATAPR